MPFAALVLGGRNDDDLPDGLQNLCDCRNSGRTHAVVIADQNSIRRWLLGADRDEQPGAQYEGENETYSRHAAEIIRMSV